MVTAAESTVMAGFGALIGATIGLQLADWSLDSAGMRTGATASTLFAITGAVMSILWVFTGELTLAGSAVTLGAGAGGLGGVILGTVTGAIVENLLVKDLS
ncbi:MAG TPA: hypothetical protein V6D18_02590 [Thermosynechococcaceae cyanobacterium]